MGGKRKTIKKKGKLFCAAVFACFPKHDRLGLRKRRKKKQLALVGEGVMKKAH